MYNGHYLQTENVLLTGEAKPASAVRSDLGRVVTSLRRLIWRQMDFVFRDAIGMFFFFFFFFYIYAGTSKLFVSQFHLFPR